MDLTQSPSPVAWLLANGETGKRIAEFPWAETGFGPLSSWPESLRLVVNLMLGSAAPMAVIWGKEYRFLYNDAYAEIIQEKHPAALGERGEIIFPETWQAIVPLFSRTMQGEGVVIDDYEVILTRGGQTKSAYFSFSYNPIRGERGIDGFLAVVIETTARVSLERERAQVFDTTLSTITDFAYSFDRQGRFNFVNQALLDLWGLKLDEAVGKNFFELKYPPELAARLQRQIEQVFRTKVQLTDETPYQSPTGEGGYYEYIFNPVFGADGEVRLVSGSTRDVTKRKHLEETLSVTIKELRTAQANLEKQAGLLESQVQERTAKIQENVTHLEAFSYGISHDMRAPLRTMQTYARIIEEEGGGSLSQEHRSYLRRIITAADRMDRLIEDVLLYSRTSHDAFVLEPVDLAQLLNEIIETYPHFRRPNSEIRVSLPLPLVQGNSVALTLCFSNLFTNAVKFVSPGTTPQIEVWAETVDPYIQIFVKDNGIGIDRSHQIKIFELFQQLDVSRGGTGIGLAIAKKAILRMGGDITVDSALGKGSTFLVSLKAAGS